jgi:formylglycine-generating enzyme required for sulfatase activity
MRVIGPAILLGLIFVMRMIASAGADSNDASDMIRVPAGFFLMCSKDGPDDERPQQQVNVGESFIDRTKVALRQVAQFINARGGHHNSTFRCAR